MRIEKLVDKFNKFLVSLEKIHYDDVEIARWLSHGHIGFNLIFAVYGKCLYYAATLANQREPEKEAKKVTKIKNMPFSLAAQAWITNQSWEIPNNNTQDFPIQCFWMLIENINRVSPN